MFTDRVTMKLVAGRGGNGIISWIRGRFLPKGGPCGGNGGKGGSITLEASHDIFSLDHFRNTNIVKAGNGADGGTNNRTGKNGASKTLLVPCGTLLKNLETGELIHDFIEHGDELEICQGGKGGLGNNHFKSPTNRTPLEVTPGREGQQIEVELELKLIADVGFVGLPNAGKSTLLSVLTPNKVKIGDYPFTTLKPNLSYIEFDDYSRIFLADIPGIIKNAHQGRGLGLEFLRHIERSQVLVYVIDVTNTPEDDFCLLREELSAYDPALLDRPSIVCLNKSDELTSNEKVDDFKRQFETDTLHVHAVSALLEISLEPLVDDMRRLAQAACIRY